MRPLAVAFASQFLTKNRDGQYFGGIEKWGKKDHRKVESIKNKFR